eukprot:14855203-Heterocapsa_arctica.AAC.1
MLELIFQISNTAVIARASPHPRPSGAGQLPPDHPTLGLANGPRTVGGSEGIPDVSGQRQPSSHPTTRPAEGTEEPNI